MVKGAIVDLVEDEDARVHGAALEALAAIKAPELGPRLVASLQAADFVERATAAKLMGEARIEGGVAHLVEAYTRGESDTAFAARAAALDSLALYGGEQAVATLRRALADREWPVRTRAASLLRGMGHMDAEPLRPAPVRWPGPFFESEALLRPQFSPHAFIDTRHGTIEVQLDVVTAALTSTNFVELSRQGFYNGMKVHRVVPAFVLQTGDPRGDGSGGPGHTIREELSPVPYLRGTIGMAIDWPETGGGQWFITTTPQPHLDAKYTPFGRVVSGWDVLDRVAVGDVIERIRIWDGVDFR
jgi:cyclophilin family peptidyl-prolyl cis-trans isomerase